MINKIEEHRFHANKMTQSDLADLTGVSRQTINAVESGKQIPSLILALKIAKVFSVPVEEIFQNPESSR